MKGNTTMSLPFVKVLGGQPQMPGIVAEKLEVFMAAFAEKTAVAAAKPIADEPVPVIAKPARKARK